MIQQQTCHTTEGEIKVCLFFLSRTQAEQLSKSRKKFLAFTYKPFFTPLYKKEIEVRKKENKIQIGTAQLPTL